MYAKVKDSTVTYPYGWAELQADNPSTAFSGGDLAACFTGTDEQVAGAELVEVTASAQPEHDPVTQTVVETSPVYVGQTLTQQWSVRDATTEEMAERRAQMRCTQLQARRALTAAGLRSQVEAAVAGGSQDTQDAWALASYIGRTDPLVSTMASSLGLTDAQLDSLFIAAAKL